MVMSDCKQCNIRNTSSGPYKNKNSCRNRRTSVRKYCPNLEERTLYIEIRNLLFIENDRNTNKQPVHFLYQLLITPE